MNMTDTIINNVTRGLVLDGKGKWVTLAHLKALECTILSHLEKGEVMHEGKWVPLQSAKTRTSSAHPTATPETGDNAPADDADHVAKKKSIPWVVVSCDAGEQHLADEQVLPLIRQISDLENTPETAAGLWEKKKGGPGKIILLSCSAIIVLSLAIFLALRFIF